MINYDPRDWVSQLFAFRGTVAPRIYKRVLMVSAWAAVVVFVNQNVRVVAEPTTVHVLVGVALGLLLVFRTNASYERFWEGRKMWGSIVNEARNLGRGAAAYLADQPQVMRSVILWGAVFPAAAMHSLRGGKGLGSLAVRLPPDEVAAALAARHVPTAVALRVSDVLARSWRSGIISDRIATSIDTNTQLLIDYLGACERIQDTPLPFAYVAHLRLALILYCMTLPLALVDAFGWSTVLDTMLITYILFGIEEIGVEVENPFGDDFNDLPLEKLCAMVEEELLSLVEPVSQPVPRDGGS